MVRIPGSVNSKYPEGKNKVKIIGKWDGYRPPMNLLLGTFHAYLVDQKVKQEKLRKGIERKFGIKAGQVHLVPWIEMLLQTPVSDYRKNAVGLILAPYFINIRKFTYEISAVLVKDWLRKCNDLRPLDYNYEYRMKYSLNTSIRKMQLPLRFDTLKTKNRRLYDQLMIKMQDNKKLDKGNP